MFIVKGVVAILVLAINTPHSFLAWMTAVSDLIWVSIFNTRLEKKFFNHNGEFANFGTIKLITPGMSIGTSFAGRTMFNCFVLICAEKFAVCRYNCSTMFDRTLASFKKKCSPLIVPTSFNTNFRLLIA